MSNSKPLSNGHDKPKIPSQSASAIRMRRHKERKRRGSVVLRSVVIEPDVKAVLVQLGWLHEAENHTRDAVTAAIGAVVMRALGAGMTSSEKPLLEIEPEALRDAWPWAKPGSQPTAENAAKALANVARCSALVGFGPREFGERLKAMADLNLG